MARMRCALPIDRYLPYLTLAILAVAVLTMATPTMAVLTR